MLFNTVTFCIFAVIFFAGWRWFRRGNNRRWGYLTAASFVFYGWWDWRFLFLLIASGLVDFLAALGMERYPRRRKLFLIASILMNLGCLGLFKYLDFLLATCGSLLGWCGLDVSIKPVGLILPVGISFYTFQSMSYSIDVYRQRLKPTHNVLHFFAYLSLFPQLVAGPIVRAAQLLGQMTQAPPVTEEQRWDGMKLIVQGFFKKMVIADNLAPIVVAAFSAATPMPSSLYWWVIMIMFAFQIYGDFSGYSDIARGLGRWMGYDFGVNFNHPYLATSLRDFWSRWHISLSTWFRDYVYIPLGGSQRGAGRAHVNMWITMVLSGLWHGAAWTFIVWGALHAALLSVERLTRWPERIMRRTGGRHLAVLLVFVFVLASWVFFRAESMTQALRILAIMFCWQTAQGHVLRDVITYDGLFFLALIVLRQLYVYFNIDLNIDRWVKAPMPYISQPVFYALILAACLFWRGAGSVFIYFQF